MLHEYNGADTIDVSDSAATFEEIYKKPYIPKEYEQDIRNADILFLPQEKFRDRDVNSFPECTREFYSYFSDQIKGEVFNVEICASDEDFQRLELHDEVINIPLILLTSTALPIVVNLISSFLYDKLKNRNKSDADANIELIVEKKGKSKTIHYKGSISGFERAMKSIENSMFDD